MNIRKELTIKKLNEPEAGRIYQKHLVKDFPPEEVKPFFVISRFMAEGRYDVYGAFLGNELAAYVFFATAERGADTIALLDYFAVVSGKRGRGIGSEVLRRLSPSRLSFRYILIEAEQIKDSLDEEERNVRERRIRFYEKAGAFRTDVYTYLYHVDYEILLMSASGTSATREEAYELTDWIYHAVYDPSWFPTLARVYL